MKDYTCKCGAVNEVELQPKGNAIGLYCSKCGKWLKWVTKEEASSIKFRFISNPNEPKNDECDNTIDTEIIYPLVVLKDRYEGIYSGGSYTAWNIEPNQIPEEIYEGDMDCLSFWRSEEEKNYIIGKGNTQQEACNDLLRQIRRVSK